MEMIELVRAEMPDLPTLLVHSVSGPSDLNFESGPKHLPA